MVPSTTSFNAHPACVQVDEKPLNSPAAAWVTTTSPTMTPEPTGTSEVLAMTLVSSGAVPPVVGGAFVVVAVSPDASGFLPYVVQAASTDATSPSPAPIRTFCRGMRRSVNDMENLSTRT